MPYLYTAVREMHDTGLPIMRALWLHHPDDPAAVARGDEYLWGRDMLVAPVVEKGATSRKVYLPRGTLVRLLDRTSASTAAARSIAPSISRRCRSTCAPARCCRWDRSSNTPSEPSDAPTTLVVYPGADGTSSLYEDDGQSFDYRKGAWMRIATRWQDSARRLTLSLAPGSRMLGTTPRKFEVRMAGSKATKSVDFSGKSTTVQM